MQPADTLEEPYFFRGQSDAFMWGLPFWEHVLYSGVYSIEKPVWWSRWTDESHYKNDTIVRSQTRTNIRAWHILLQRSIPNELCTFTPRRHAAEWTAAISHISGSDVWSESVSHWASQSATGRVSICAAPRCWRWLMDMHGVWSTGRRENPVDRVIEDVFLPDSFQTI